MLSRLALFLILPVVAAVAFAVAYFVFYRGGYEPPPAAEPPLEQVSTTWLAPRESAEPPPGELRRGLLLVDAQHYNSFTESELVSFTSRVAERGFDVEFLGNLRYSRESAHRPIHLAQLTDRLRKADSLAVILPHIPFTQAEADVVERFVQKGGKLLLVSDPGRSHNINALAKRFRVEFQTDYLYNTQENDTNFRRILIRDFLPDQLTAGLETITLDYASSVQSAGDSLAFTSANTKSSLLQAVGTYSPMAWGDNRNVLALADFTFMVPINDSLLDNGRLVSNIADYLTDSDREYHLSDYPYFYGSPSNSPPEGGNTRGDVDILMGQPDLLSTGLQVKTALAGHQLNAQVVAAEDTSRDAIFLGLYEDAPQVAQYLQVAGIRVDDTLGAAFASDIPLESSAVMVLAQSQGRDMLIMLADTQANLDGAVARLVSGEFRQDLASDFVALLKFENPENAGS